MSATATLAAKDLRLLIRDRAGLFWVVFFPLLMAVFFGAIFGGEGGGASPLPIAVVDEDGSDGSRRYIERLEASEALAVTRAGRAEAVDAVRRGKLVAYVVLRKGFGTTGGVFGGDAPAVEAGIDPSRRAESGYLEGLLTQAVFAGLQDQFADPRALRNLVRGSRMGADTSSALPEGQRDILDGFLGSLDLFLGTVDTAVYRQGPAFATRVVEIAAVEESRDGPRSAFEISFAQGMVWAIIGTVSAFAVSIVKEKTDGTYLRLRLSPLTRGSILAGKGLACFVACASTMSLLLLVGRVVFHVRILSLPGIALAVLCAALGFTGIMMLIATLGRTVNAVSGAGWAVLLVMAMLGGGMVPLMVMPPWMQTASNVSPVKWAVLAFEGAIWRAFTLREMLLPCGVLLAAGALFFALGVARTERAER